MSFDLQLFGAKLRKCRENLEISQHELASELFIENSRLISLEKGEILPSGDEILMFADYFRQDYHFFINNIQKTSIEKVSILYRKFGNEFSKSDRKAIQEFLYLCECEQQLYDLVDFSTKMFHPEILGTIYKNQGKSVAKQLRSAFGIKNINLINDPYNLFRKLGIHIFRRKLESSSISGLFIMHPVAGKCILVNYDEDIYRQNFTVAHEVAHAIFDYSNEVNVSFESDNKNDLREVRANYFASHFLISEDALANFKGTKWTSEILLNLCIQFKVNTQPLIIALKNSNLISEDEVRKFKNIKVSRELKLDPELNNTSEKRAIDKRKLLKMGLNDQYVRLSYFCYEKGLISAQRLSEMMLIDEKDLEEVLNIYNFPLLYGN